MVVGRNYVSELLERLIFIRKTHLSESINIIAFVFQTILSVKNLVNILEVIEHDFAQNEVFKGLLGFFNEISAMKSFKGLIIVRISTSYE